MAQLRTFFNIFFDAWKKLARRRISLSCGISWTMLLYHIVLLTNIGHLKTNSTFIFVKKD